MTPDTTLDPIDATQPIQPPSTAGMTTKVVKGSLWTLGGSVLPLAVSFISTPFIIRFLGAESYGVLLLVGLIPTYFGFADFGMGIASTKFSSEAYGEGDTVKESKVVWTAATIAFVVSLIIAVPIFIFASWIVAFLNVPEHLLTEATLALRIGSVAFVLGILGTVLNSPMLARLRMDLNTITAAVPKILLAAVTPIILYFGGGIVGAVSWAFIVGVASFVCIAYFSGRLLPELFRPKLDRSLLDPLLRFGGAWFIAVLAGILIGNLEKFVLSSLVSVKALAYYSIAFTFANISTLFSQAMLQSLLPAFSQIISVERRPQLNALFSRGIRLSIVALLPVVVFLFVVGRPFLTIWAGPDFGSESTLPFYILLCGFSLSIFSVLPYCILLAAGRTDYFAKMYWIELPFYAALVWFLVGRYGIVGAAIAYAVRTVVDAIWAIVLCNRVVSPTYELASYAGPLLLSLFVFAPVVFIAAVYSFSPWLILAVAVSFTLYGSLAWTRLLNVNEKLWFISKVRTIYASN